MHKRTALTASLIAMLSVVGVAQLVPSSQEQINIPIGAIFEIQAAKDNSTQFNWTLTQGQQFVEASRTHVFQTRFTQAGTYTLLGQLGDDTGNLTASRTFQINVQPRKPEDNSAALNPDTNVGDLVTFMPPLSNGEVRLNASRQVLEVRHARADISVIAIDLDTEKDSNNDTQTANDDDTRDTLFRTNPNPLYLWFAGQRNHTLKAGALLSDNTTKFQDFSVRFTDEPIPTNNQQPTVPDAVSTGDGEIVVIKSDNGTLQLAVRLNTADTTPMLYQWKFGDGGQSLLDKPIHTYAEGGTYEVSVTVRDLKTGKTLSTVSDSIVVNRLRDDINDGSSSAASTASNEPVNQASSDSSGLLGMIVKILLGLILSAAAGVGIIFVIGKLKKKNFSLEKTMEKAEKTMVGTVPSATPLTMEMPIDEPLPPTETSVPDIRLNVIDSEPVEAPVPSAAPSEPEAIFNESKIPVSEPKPLTPHTSMEPSAEQLKADTANAPAWLKAGIETAQVVGQTPTAPPPDDLAKDTPVDPFAPVIAEPVAPTPVPEPVPEPQPETPSAATPPPAPETFTAPQEPISVPTEEPTVVPVPEVPPQPIETITADPAPVPAPTTQLIPETKPVNPPVAPATPETPVAKPQVTTPQDAEREEREREKKRLKRQRYRENKKKRDAESKAETPSTASEVSTSQSPADSAEDIPDDETVAIIRAESVSTEQTPPPLPSTPTETKPEEEKA